MAPRTAVKAHIPKVGFMSFHAFEQSNSPIGCLSHKATYTNVRVIVTLPKIAWIHVTGN